MLTQQDLEAVANLSAYEAVERLRPAWLRIRGTTSVAFAGDQLPSAMVDDTHTDLSVLRGLRTGNLREMRFIDGRDATTRYGTGYVNGIIQVFTRRGP